MTSTPSVRADRASEQAPPVPDRMGLVSEWETPEHENIEIYADYRLGDGRIIAIGGGRVTTAAMVSRLDEGDGVVTWLAPFTSRPRTWRNLQAGIARARLAEGRS